MEILMQLLFVAGGSFCFFLLFFLPCAKIRKSIWDLAIYEFLFQLKLSDEIPKMRKRFLTAIRSFIFIFIVLVIVYFFFNFLFLDSVIGICASALFIFIAGMNSSYSHSYGDVSDFIENYKEHIDLSIKKIVG
jgi:hypothetical protein